MFNRILSTLALYAFLVPTSAQAEVPSFMQYQGYLTSMADEPIRGFFTMNFALYAQAESGEPVWSEEREGVEVTAGRFSLLLGDRIPIDGAIFAQGQLYLQVTVEGDRLWPREAISTVAHAFHADVAENAVGDITPRTVSVGGQPVIDDNGNWIGAPTGLAGPRGEQGIQGERGETGVQGLTGERGPQGEQGIQGERGETGVQGLTGELGQRGAQGVRGERGAIGAIGAQGEQGATGVQGLQGERGLIGPMPAHGWNGTQLRFRSGVDSWGDYVDLQGPRGDQGPAGPGAALIRRTVNGLAHNAGYEVDTGAGDTPIFAQAWYRQDNLWQHVLTPIGNGIPTCGACGSGSNGVFAPTNDTQLTGGTYEFESFSIPANVRVEITGGAPLDIRCQKPVLIAGTLYIPPGTAGGGGGGGPGGTGAGPGGGQGRSSRSTSGAGGGFGTRGQDGSGTTGGATYGDPHIALTAGSGGGGQFTLNYFTNAGGGAGGGALRITAPSVTVSGTITANGGVGGRGNGGGGGGSGGSIWLRGSTVAVTGAVTVQGGAGGAGFMQGGAGGRPGGAGGMGRIRIDGFDVTGETTPAFARGDTTGLAVVPSSRIRFFQPRSGVVRVENYTGANVDLRLVIQPN